MNIAVIGGHKCSKKHYNIAKKLGNLIAKEGWILICGGREGVMEAVCFGVKQAGGLSVGILPSYDGSDANKYVDIKIPTGLGYARNILVVRAADVVVAIGGSWGTLSEIAFALNEGKIVLGIDTFKIKGIKQVKNPEAAIKYIKKIYAKQRANKTANR
ncbi:MAG: TIGR00725 family protein [Candidatus Omnitrophica bacterium]|nr:TIGR00725 family protein [Candidatus Omnitrophota bacterium]